jgi:LPXTG-site transpeptidase (sortase) family protein
MTTVLDSKTSTEVSSDFDNSDDLDAVSEPLAEEVNEPTRSLTTGQLVGLWIVIAVVILGIVLYLVEPMFQQREQGLLLERYRTSIDKAANQSSGLGGVEVSSIAPSIGSAVGILEIGAIGLRQVVVEGTAASNTMVGPGHVPGTAAPGQPGNSVIVGRNSMYGGPFGDLSKMAVGDQIVVSTTQGQSLYEVTDAGSVQLNNAATPTAAPDVPAPTPVSTTTSTTVASEVDPAATTETTVEATTTTVAAEETTTTVEGETATTEAPTTTTTAAVESALGGGSIPLNSLYGTSTDDRLTLVTSGSAFPWNSGEATVVIAVMKGKPFEPTPQNGRSAKGAGNEGDSSKWPVTVLAFLCLAAAVGGAVLLYRRTTPKIAYLLTVPPLLAFAILASESFSLLLPAWS